MVSIAIIIITYYYYFDITDLDECDSQNGGCDQICTNNNGSFLCSCSTGYTLADDDLSCEGKWYIYYIMLILLLSLLFLRC